MNGILLLDKPSGVTSNAALQEVKQLFRARKAGHTGSLDPLATGLLPICFGAATKVSAYLLDADKRYRVRVRLGISTTTGDAEGEVIDTASTEGITKAGVLDTLERYQGEIQQLPPMYSALKHKGERLYKLARQGVEVERQPRTIRIHEMILKGYENSELDLDIHCTKGTYVRTLAEDIGRDLGCGAHVTGLRRTGVGPFGDDAMVDMIRLKGLAADGGLGALDSLLLPVDAALEHWAAVTLSDDAAYYLRLGQAVLVPNAPTAGWVRIYSKDHRFIGVGCIQDDGRVAPKRLLEDNRAAV